MSLSRRAFLKSTAAVARASSAVWASMNWRRARAQRVTSITFPPALMPSYPPNGIPRYHPDGATVAR